MYLCMNIIRVLQHSNKSILIKNYFTYFKKFFILGKPKWLTIRTLLVLRKKILKTSNFFLKIRINFLKIILRKKSLILRKKLLVLRIFFLKTSNVRIVNHFGLPRIFLKQEFFFLKQEIFFLK